MASGFALAAGDQVGGFVLEQPLGEGGAGQVWGARGSGGEVALKFLKVGSNSFDARRLRQEAEALATLDHPNILRSMGVVFDPIGRPVLITEWLRGESLAERLRRGRLSVAEVSEALGPICEALVYVHLRGLIHRDLKPSNIFLLRDAVGSRPVLLDFGLVKLLHSLGAQQLQGSVLTQSGDLLGTPHYMAPEQLGGERSIDHRADIWSFGVVLRECLAGEHPIRERTLGAVMKAVFAGGWAPLGSLGLGIPPGLSDLVGRMTTRAREERLGSLVPVRELLRGASGFRGSLGELKPAPPLLVLGDASSSLRASLASLALPVITSPSEVQALRLLETQPISVVLYAGSMRSVGRFLGEVEARYQDVPVLLVADAAEEVAGQEALRGGAADLLVSPVEAEELKAAIARSLSRRPEREEHPPATSVRVSPILGSSAAMKEVMRLVERVAPTSASVLIRGESGTGKEMIAEEIHGRSVRRGGPLVKLHCAAIPDSLLESELFGHEKGAFTGAFRRKPGRLELAHGGTLFLDELGDIPPPVQVKLLRFLQEQEFERVGGTETIKVDTRILAATHRNLEEMIRQGQFREDLFYRVNVVPLWLPPLRARRDDILLLVEHLTARLSAHHGKPGLTFSGEALALLRRERWPGNVRQLQNVVERLVVLATGSVVTEADVREDLKRSEAFVTQAPTLTGQYPRQESLPAGLSEAAAAAERQVIEAALQQAGGNRTLAARILGISRRTLYNKLDLLGIS